jgi:xanthine/CO dehydrogenase XdhC/CoxF family maturation factor
MSQSQQIHALAARLDTGGEPYALATLVKAAGSSYRRPGARVVVAPDGATAGIISGGCLEREIAHHALRVLASGRPEVVRFAAPRGEDPFGTGAGCGGTVHVLVQRVDPRDPAPRALTLLAQAAAADAPHALATVFRADGVLAGEVGRHLLSAPGGAARGSVAHPALRAALAAAGERALATGRTATLALSLAGGRAEALVECVLPPVRLAVFGGGPDVEALVRQGAAVGWRVAVVGTRPADELRAALPMAAEWVPLVHAEQAAERVRLTPRTAAVVMTHGYARDRELVRALLKTPVPYVGVIGSRRRFADLLRELADDAPRGGGARRRLFGPAGLDLGAETPEEIALAVVAEAQAVLAGRSARPLRGRRRAHAAVHG